MLLFNLIINFGSRRKKALKQIIVLSFFFELYILFFLSDTINIIGRRSSFDISVIACNKFSADSDLTTPIISTPVLIRVLKYVANVLSYLIVISS